MTIRIMSGDCQVSQSREAISERSNDFGLPPEHKKVQRSSPINFAAGCGKRDRANVGSCIKLQLHLVLNHVAMGLLQETAPITIVEAISGPCDTEVSQFLHYAIRNGILCFYSRKKSQTLENAQNCHVSARIHANYHSKLSRKQQFLQKCFITFSFLFSPRGVCLLLLLCLFVLVFLFSWFIDLKRRTLLAYLFSVLHNRD